MPVLGYFRCALRHSFVVLNILDKANDVWYDCVAKSANIYLSSHLTRHLARAGCGFNNQVELLITVAVWDCQTVCILKWADSSFYVSVSYGDLFFVFFLSVVFIYLFYCQLLLLISLSLFLSLSLWVNFKIPSLFDSLLWYDIFACLHFSLLLYLPPYYLFRSRSLTPSLFTLPS